ncbi:MAG: FKBP-type peptidyl-prolyl cis-trans isomerase [Thermoplasmata archaeon]|nr:FKBP-type peptidyl-prolyl cis-trans isomerase [Thermoplasmata archaeon]
MKKGDFIRLEFDAWVKEPKELFDTTDEELAKKEGKYVEGGKYGPIVTIVGEGKVIQGLDEALLEADVGEEKEIEIPPEKAFGPRNPKLIEMHSIRELLRLPEFRRGEQYPAPGMEVTIGRKKGVITTLAAGRARIDFNHPYAGKTFIYRFKVIEVVEDPVEKVKAIIRLNYGREEDFEVSLEEKILRIIIPDFAKLDSNWIAGKLGVVADVRKYLDVGEIIFEEKYPGKSPEERDREHEEGVETPTAEKEEKVEEKKEKEESDKDSGDEGEAEEKGNGD